MVFSPFDATPIYAPQALPVDAPAPLAGWEISSAVRAVRGNRAEINRLMRQARS
jgi:hypothetical protein